MQMRTCLPVSFQSQALFITLQPIISAKQKPVSGKQAAEVQKGTHLQGQIANIFSTAHGT